MVAKNATATPEGTVVCWPMSATPFPDVMSGPNTEVNSTATHIEVMASDAHMSRASSHHARRVCVGASCATVVMSILLQVQPERRSRARPAHRGSR